MYFRPLSDDEYYDQTPVRLQQKQMEQSWIHGQYENFEVRWTQDPHYRMGPPQPGYQGHQISRDPHYPADRAYRVFMLIFYPMTIDLTDPN